MAQSYRALFRIGGTIPLTTAGLIARMPLSMIGIGLITMVATDRGSYAFAGALAAVFAVSSALATPQVARLVDRFGQSRIVPLAVMVSAAALACLLVTYRLDGPLPVIFVSAAIAGLLPSVPALVRVRWVGLLQREHDRAVRERPTGGSKSRLATPGLHTAFAWETVLDDVSFVIGPPISIGLSVGLFPEAGPLAGGVLLLIGAGWLIAQRETEPRPGRHEITLGPLSVLRERTVWGIVLVMIALGAILGTVDVASVAFAERQGIPAAASVVLAVYALGSALSGIIFGAVATRRPTRLLLRVGLIGTAVTTLPLIWVGTVTSLSVSVFIAGAFFAPTMILATKLIEETVPARALTEALTWTTAGLAFGVAIGPAVAGPLIDALGPSGGFRVSLVAAVILIALLPLVTRIGPSGIAPSEATLPGPPGQT
ncbi:MFS transporter [Leucobacter luti]|uniref:MFS transporter n=1 Tax=Leucobacter luti TaxID=340320 RepID=UPI00104D6D22|nr:MFS transporter [Leucobacter luti]MCW2288053.1 MFS family permease [Leucobacter luti]TCK45785.1 MFS transporter [Leucobacter luti]